jgi:hypothetical protein
MKLHVFITVLGLLFFIIILQACMSNRKALTQWIGANQNELIEKWGNPDRIEEDGINSVWVYERFGNRFPGTTGAKSARYDDGPSEYDTVSGVKFIISPNRVVRNYELVHD